MKLTTDRHEASCGPLATAELSVFCVVEFLIGSKLSVLFCCCVVMDIFVETSAFFENAEKTLHDVLEKVSRAHDVPREYIPVLKDCLNKIRVLQV